MALRDQQSARFRLVDLPEGIDGAARIYPDRCYIAVSTTLDPISRRCVLGHELIHWERGGGSRHPDPIVRRREERTVDRIAVARLVPADELAAWLVRRGDEPTTAADVADEWRVTECYATIALERAREAT